MNISILSYNDQDLIDFVNNIIKSLSIFEFVMDNLFKYINSPSILTNNFDDFNNLLTNDFILD